jgi:predicted RNase H-like nuclease (RuvC/YqgF family)
MQTKEIFQKRQEEIDALSAAISNHEKVINALKPHVLEYNDRMKTRKELRKQLAAKQREAKIVQEWFKGTTIIDERFPLFANTENEQSTESITS